MTVHHNYYLYPGISIISIINYYIYHNTITISCVVLSRAYLLLDKVTKSYICFSLAQICLSPLSLPTQQTHESWVGKVFIFGWTVIPKSSFPHDRLLYCYIIELLYCFDIVFPYCYNMCCSIVLTLCYFVALSLYSCISV